MDQELLIEEIVKNKIKNEKMYEYEEEDCLNDTSFVDW